MLELDVPFTSDFFKSKDFELFDQISCVHKSSIHTVHILVKKNGRME